MSGFPNGSIILDEVRNIYYAGQVLTGKIEFGLSQPLVFKAINVEFHGEATVEWTETQVEEYDGYRREINQDYTAKEDYFHVVHLVCGGVGVSQLPAGSHSIPFRYQIPPTAPSYYDGSNGNVSYYVKACLEYPDGREPDELEEAFEVVVPFDMNMNPAMKEPIYMEFEEILSGYCCGSGPLTVQVKLPATGFCPGQAIPVEINADNQSSVEIHSIKLELMRRDGYHSTSPQSDQYPPPESLKCHWLGAILPHTKRTMNTDFIIPDMIAPVLDNCSIIDVEFYFKVKLKLSGCNDHLEDEAQIYLGLVPLAELVDGQYTHPMQQDLPTSPIPNLNAPPEFIQPYIYPSVTLENRMHSSHVQNVSNYPGSNAYPGQPGAGYPNNYPPGNAPYPGANPPPPNANQPYPNANQPYPNANQPYPGANHPLAGVNPQHPGANPPYPVASPPYPGVNHPPAGGNSPYPIANSPNHAANPPYHGANGPPPGPNPLYPNASPFAPNPAGFKVPAAASPGYPMGPVASSYNPGAPSAPPQ